ncbi:MAG: hypothetical protein WCG01_02305 [bacterium]
MINISKQQFEAFEKVRLSGKTNMFDFQMVAKLGKIDQETVKKIITNYSVLKFKYQSNDKKENA